MPIYVKSMNVSVSADDIVFYINIPDITIANQTIYRAATDFLTGVATTD